MFLGIDGTGPFFDSDYEAAMHDSFVHRLHRECREPRKRYMRGPELLGVECEAMATLAAAWVQEQAVASGDLHLLIAGYSRGGAIAIRVAQLLAAPLTPIPIIIDCMALFDPVDREPVSDTSVIPNNVLRAYEARQDYQHVHSRPAFYNWGLMDDCGSSIESPGHLKVHRFRSTHAGMGGVPWTGDHPGVWHGSGGDGDPYVFSPFITERQDREGSQSVHDWMWRKVQRHGMVP